MITDSINLHCEGITYRVGIHPFQYTVRSILSGVLELDIVNTFNDNIKNRIIKDITDKEDEKNPYTDQDIVNILMKKKYNIARRTVTKYRESLQIPIARLRRKNI